MFLYHIKYLELEEIKSYNVFISIFIFFDDDSPYQNSRIALDITYRKENNKWIVEVWMQSYPERGGDLDAVYDEDTYVAINDWCKKNLSYHARTAYHVFELKKQQHLNWFLLRWS
jgi:hypothetical protein